MKNQLLILILLLSITIISCSDDDDPMVNPSCDTNDMSFQDDVSPIFRSNCLGCHSTTAASGNIILDTYTGVKATVDNGRLLGAIRHNSGFSAMPQGGDKLSTCNIDKIDSWVSAGAMNN